MLFCDRPWRARLCAVPRPALGKREAAIGEQEFAGSGAAGLPLAPSSCQAYSNPQSPKPALLSSLAHHRGRLSAPSAELAEAGLAWEVVPC